MIHFEPIKCISHLLIKLYFVFLNCLHFTLLWQFSGMMTIEDRRIQMRHRCIICGTWEVYFHHPLWILRLFIWLCVFDHSVWLFSSHGFHILCRLSSISFLVLVFSFISLLVIFFISFIPFLLFVQINILPSPSIWFSVNQWFWRGKGLGFKLVTWGVLSRACLLRTHVDHLLECS